MKFKSKLGFAALEELTEDKAPEVGEGGEAKADGAAAAPDAAAAAPVVAEGAAPAGDDTAAAAAATGEAAPAAAPAEGTDGAAAAAAVTDPAVVDAAAATDAAPAATDAAAAAPTTTEDPAAAEAAAAATGNAEATGEPTAVVAEVTGDVGEAEAEEVEGEMEAVDTIEGEANDISEDVEKLEAATESLEGCVAVLDAAAQRGGLDIFGASLLRNNLNTVTGSLKVKNLVLPALEDMETPSAKIDGANNAKDQIVAFIKRIIEAIKSAFDRLGEWIVETYKRLTNAFIAIERRAEKLAESVKTGQMRRDPIESKALAEKMTAAAAPVKDLPKLLDGMKKMAEKLNDPKTYSPYLNALALCEEMSKQPEKIEEIRGKISAELARWAADMERLGTYNNDFTVSNGGGVKSFGIALFSNQVMNFMIPSTAEGIKVMSANIITAKTGADSAGTSVAPLDQAEASKICAQVAAIAKELREMAEGHRGGVKQLNSEIKKHKDVIAALNNSAADDGDAALRRRVILFVNSLLMTAPKLPIHTVNRAMPRNLGYALDYVAASIAGSAAAAAPAAAPAQAAAA